MTSRSPCRARPDTIDGVLPVAVVGENVSIKHFSSRLRRPCGLDLTVSAGEVLVVTGPSGCGKSSLALALNGLIPHRVEAELGGRVVVWGADVAGSDGLNLPGTVGVVFQDPDAQLIATRVLDEVCFGLENLETPADQIEPHALVALEQVGLLARRDESPDRLSGGQRQRLALACAVAMRPRLLVLDEPTAHIDPAGAASFLGLLPELRAAGMTIVVIDHDLDQVVEHADRVLVLDHLGASLAEGQPAQVFYESAKAIIAAGVRLPIAVRTALALSDAGATDVGRPASIREAEGALSAANTERCGLSSAAPPPPPPPPPMLREELLRAEGLRVDRGRHTVISDLSLSVRRGEFTAIVGPNGAGKTTAGLALAGLIASTGTLRIDGEDPRRLTMRRLSDRVGYVFQNPEHQFITHTVSDEIAHGLRRRHRPDREITERVDELLERLDLAAVRDRHPFCLSGGQKRRLSVATVLATAPELLILDEPTYGLDAGSASALMALLSDLNRQGRTIVTIVHDLALAADHAHRVLGLNDGVVVIDAPVAEALTDDGRLARIGLAPLPLRQCLAGLRERDPRFADVYRLDQIEATGP